MLKNNYLKKIAVVCVFALTLTACGTPKDKEPTTSNPAEKTEAAQVAKEETSKADKTTLLLANSADTGTLDPHASGDSATTNALQPIFETLVVYDFEKNELIPNLAESWERVDDVTYKFNLRKGVKFHNGDEMKASDVVFSFKRATGPMGAKVAYIMKIVDPNGFEIIDDYTVIVRTLYPFTPFLGYMPYIGAVIMPEKEYTDENSPALQHPIGTGPMKFVEWKKGDRITFERFDEYWGEKEQYEKMIIRSIPESNTKLIELETGGVDLAIGMSPNDIKRIQESPKLNLFESPTTVFMYLGMNTAKAPFDNLKFRQAIDYALNEEGINAAVYRGAAVYTPGPVTPNQKYFDDSDVNCRYDVEKAKQLLAESGVDTSKTFTLTVNENQVRIDTAQIIQTQLAEIGINVEIKVMETATYFQFIVGDETELFLNGWGAVGFPEPDNNLYGPLHSSQIPATNSQKYSNPELDKLLDDSRLVPDGPEREKIVKDIQKLIRNEVPYITISNPANYIGAQSYIDGFIANPTSQQMYHGIVIK